MINTFLFSPTQSTLLWAQMATRSPLLNHIISVEFFMSQGLRISDTFALQTTYDDQEVVQSGKWIINNKIKQSEIPLRNGQITLIYILLAYSWLIWTSLKTNNRVIN
ncbi:hypothetical protein U1Q18_052634 [Sarracenia purpurea var. burkii]